MTSSRTRAPIRPAPVGLVGPRCLGSAAVVTELDLALGDGRTLHAYDTHPGADRSRRRVLAPRHAQHRLAARAAVRGRRPTSGLRWVSYDRPGYGGSTPLPGRDIASAAADTAAVADALGIERLAVIGHSGGGPHALACGALLRGPRRRRGQHRPGWRRSTPRGSTGSPAWPPPAWLAPRRRRGARGEGAVRGSGVEYDPEFTPADLAVLEATGRGSATSSARRWRPGRAV